MITLELFYSLILVALATMAWHVTWFRSTLPVLVFKLLRWWGLKKRDSDGAFWPEPIDYRYWTREEWADWSSMKLPLFFAELLNCPWCLCWHISFWNTLFFTILGILPLHAGAFLISVPVGVTACAWANHLFNLEVHHVDDRDKE